MPPWPVLLWTGLVIGIVVSAYERSGRAGVRTLPLLLLMLLIVRGSPIGWGIAVAINGLLGFLFVAIAFRSGLETGRVVTAGVTIAAEALLLAPATRRWVGLGPSPGTG